MHILIAFFIFAIVLHTPAFAGKTLDAVKERGVIRCGVNNALVGFSAPTEKGDWRGLDVEFCRAVSAAVLGDPDKVEYIPLSASERLLALQNNKIDILSRNTTWTLSRDAGLGMRFAGVMFYDGQGFIVPASLNITEISQLNGTTICVQSGTTSEVNLVDYFRSHSFTYTPLVFDKFDDSVEAFLSGKCQAYSTDASGLAVVRARAGSKSEQYVLLEEIISKEPLGPSVMLGDDEWFAINRWVLFALLEAEEHNITSKNVDELKISTIDPYKQRLLGVVPGIGKPLVLNDNWFYNIVKKVGNYGEIYDRSIGQDSPLQLDRGFNGGINLLWTNGGLLYAPSLR
ncbi:MAG: amino acid ABC transporter substrate-binding protein [Alphaproteobacteria bacterium]|jgi:general L-amino acid transport system substrate-binding protein|nr:amino acid ABC transporter substrate-binding protein [Alphaproteobacteria bacterium]